MPLRHVHGAGAPHDLALLLSPETLIDARAGFRNDRTETFGISTEANRIDVAQLPESTTGLEAFRNWGESAGDLIRAINTRIQRPYAIDFSSVELSAAQLRQLVGGVISGLGGSNSAEQVTLTFHTLLDDKTFTELLEDEMRTQRAIELAASLVDMRSNQLTPVEFAKRARTIATNRGLGCRITGADELRAQGFGGIAAIGQGSANGPVLVELWHSGNAALTEEPPEGALAIAGKGVTFDSGGLSLKPPTSMYGMHTDCAGAATVLAAMSTLTALNVSTAVYAALPLVENIPSSNSVRPGDVVTMRNGMGLEIIDTDFEGRVILADAVGLLAESKPKAVVSLATLTYQIVVALGPEIAGLFSRDAQLAQRLLASAERSGEALWKMPWAERYRGQLTSIAPGADLRNHPLHDSGRAITAALLIGEFVPKDIPFAHIDFAGPAVKPTPNGPVATGYGVRTIIDFIVNWEQ